ncbi:MAG: hypothetical protein KTR15_02035 [Phycisphaeraceae bacterium]|nr:hypothetical protein [Phycisphaeraceae bacterium]
MTARETPILDQAKAEQFAQGLMGTINQASLALMLSIGHRTGLFDVMATLPASTSTRIADTAGLDERYVREWLGAMVTGRVVEYDAGQKTYALPPEHAAFLTRAAGGDNFANTMQWISVLGGVETEAVEKFENGGGEGLGTVWGEELAVKMLGEAGFGDFTVERSDHDMINNYYICR